MPYLFPTAIIGYHFILDFKNTFIQSPTSIQLLQSDGHINLICPLLFAFECLRTTTVSNSAKKHRDKQNLRTTTLSKQRNTC